MSRRNVLSTHEVDPRDTRFLRPLPAVVLPTARARSLVLISGGAFLLLLFGAGWIASFFAKNVAGIYLLAVFFSIPSSLAMVAIINGLAMRSGRCVRGKVWFLLPPAAIVVAIAGAIITAMIRFGGH